MGLVAAGTWILAGRFQSPAQVEAAALPPAAGPITAAVRQGGLSDSITARAVFTAGESRSIPLTGAPEAVVTGHPTPAGDGLEYGRALIEINGRPQFIVPGQFPFYRDLTVGDRGPDVEQWQEYLRMAGYSIARGEKGTVGPETARATERFYTRRGYLAPARTLSTDLPAATADPSAAPSSAAPSPDADDAGTIVLPQSETLVLPSAGGTVATLPDVGSRLGDAPQVTVDGGALAGTIAIPPLDSVSLREGMALVITTEDGQAVDGKLGPVPSPAVPDADGQVPDVRVPVVLPSGIPAEWEGKDLLVQIIKQKVADDALVVPARAVSQENAGTAVYARQDDGSFRRIPVTVIGTAAGETAVAATDGSALAAGQLVRLG